MVDSKGISPRDSSGVRNPEPYITSVLDVICKHVVRVQLSVQCLSPDFACAGS